MKRKVIKAIKGSISIFLIIIMLPFLEIGGALVELNRYKSNTALLDEIMGSSAFSTLSNFDKYVQKRFGLFSVTQEEDIDKIFIDYLVENNKVTHNSMQLTNIGLNFNSQNMSDFTLAKDDLLRSQIENYTKIGGLIKLGTDFFDIDEILKIFEGLSNFQTIVNTLSGAVDLAGGVVDFLNTMIDLANKTSNVRNLAKDYKTKFENFDSSALRYYQAKIEYYDALERERAAISEYNTALANSSNASANVIECKDKTSESLLRQINLENQIEKLKEKGEDTEDLENQLENEINFCKGLYKDLNDAYRDESSANQSLSKAINKKTTASQNVSNCKTALDNARNDLNSKKIDYSGKISELKAGLSEYKTALNSVKDEIGNLQKSSVAFVGQYINASTQLKNNDREDQLKDEIEKLDKKANVSKEDVQKYYDYKYELSQIQSENTNASIGETVSGAAEQGLSSLKESTDSFTNPLISSIDTGIFYLDYEYGKLGSFNADSNTGSSGVNDNVYYKFTKDDAFDVADKDAILEFVADVENDILNSGFLDMVKAIKTIIENLFNTKLFFDSNLNAIINTEEYRGYGLEIKDPSSQNALCSLFQGLLSPITTFLDCSEGWTIKNIISKLTGIIPAIKSIVDLINGISQMVLHFIENVTHIKDSLLISAYIIYMLPCRTDYNSGSNINSTYDFSQIPYDSSGYANATVPLVSSLKQLFHALAYTNSNGSNKMFRGAELEYVMGGSNNEVYNQLLTFGSLYMFRFILDIIPIATNKEVRSMAEAVGAASFGIGSAVVYLLIILIEPFIDDYVLVNGGDIPIWKSSIYLTPSGIPDLLSSLGSVISFTATQKNSITNNCANYVGKATGTTPHYDFPTGSSSSTSDNAKDYLKNLLSFDYKQHMFFILLLNGNIKGELKLLKNLIQMEGSCKYKDSGFDIRKTYTVVEGKATVKLGAAYPGLIDYSLIGGTKTVIRGY